MKTKTKPTKTKPKPEPLFSGSPHLPMRRSALDIADAFYQHTIHRRCAGLSYQNTLLKMRGMKLDMAELKEIANGISGLTGNSMAEILPLLSRMRRIVQDDALFERATAEDVEFVFGVREITTKR